MGTCPKCGGPTIATDFNGNAFPCDRCEPNPLTTRIAALEAELARVNDKLSHGWKFHWFPDDGPHVTLRKHVGDIDEPDYWTVHHSQLEFCGRFESFDTAYQFCIDNKYIQEPPHAN